MFSGEPGGGFLAALLADSVDLEGVAGGGVVVTATDFLLDLADLLREKFDRTAAFGADHVVMAAAVVLVLVPRNAVVKGDFAGQSAFGQQLQGTVDGGVSDGRIFFLYKPVQFFGGKMVAGLKKRAQDGVSLGGLLQSDALEMAVQNALRLAHHFARDGRLVIDALLQHEGSG
jgi:hypothetical protein